MVVKVNSNQVFQNYQCLPGEYCFHPSKESKWMDTENKLTLSLKVGKRRVLVTGRIRLEINYYHYGQYRSDEWFFKPNNPEKLERILDAH